MLAITVAIASFIVAMATLYFTHLRPPNIRVHVGPRIDLGYELGPAAFFAVPVTFVNAAPNTAVILFSALLIKLTDEHDWYFLPWNFFAAYNTEDDEWQLQEDSHAFPIPGKSAVHRTIWFSWDIEGPPLVFREGTYEFVFVWRESRRSQTQTFRSTLRLSRKAAASLQENMDERSEEVVTIGLAHEQQDNGVMADEEVKQFLAS